MHVPGHKIEALRELASETLETLAAESCWRTVSSGRRRVFEVCAGMCCTSIAHWLDFPDGTQIIAVDNMHAEKFWKGVPTELHACVTYVCMDVLELSLERMSQIVRQTWDCGLSGVDHVHWSHMCECQSRASRGFALHRWPDFSPRSAKAIAHDARFHFFLAVLVELVRAAPLVCVSLENTVYQTRSRPSPTCANYPPSRAGSSCSVRTIA